VLAELGAVEQRGIARCSRPWTRAAIILFVTRRNATVAITSAGGRLAGHSNCRQAKGPADPSRRRDYIFLSPHDDQRTISLALLPVVVPKSAEANGNCDGSRSQQRPWCEGL
jgi:hypothetical protein